MTTYSEENFLPQSGLATAIGKAQFYADKSMRSVTSELEERYRKAAQMWAAISNAESQAIIAAAYNEPVESDESEKIDDFLRDENLTI